MTGFQIFTKALVPLTKEPTITVQKNGVLSLNKAAEVALNSPRAVHLLFDPDMRIIGIRSAEPGSPNSCAVRAVAGPNSAPYVISAVTFLRFFGVEFDVSRRWTAYLDDDMLCINLREESVRVTSNRAKRSGSTGQ